MPAATPPPQEGSPRVRTGRAMSPPARRRHADPAEADGTPTQEGVEDAGRRPQLATSPRPAPIVGRASPAHVAPSLADVAGLANRSPLAGGLLGSRDDNPFTAACRLTPVSEIPSRVLERYLTQPECVKAFQQPLQSGKQPDKFSMRRFKMTLVGAGEAGKTSLKKCFASTPLFFKNLPDVGTTTGIDVQWHRPRVPGGFCDVEVMDFAGQEVYHSHSLFLSNRSLIVFVWNMSACEQTFDDYGISADDERRLKQWADVVQAKSPGAPMVVVGTHKDMLRDQSNKSITMILSKVCRVFRDYTATFSPTGDVKTIAIQSSFCVSCKDRTAVPENVGGPQKVKDLFQWLCEICFMQARTDPVFQQGMIPRSVVHLISTLHQLKQDMETVLIPIKEYNSLCKQLGIPRDFLHPLTQALHDWDVLYLFDRQGAKLGRQDCVFLHPQWLSQMVATVFSYAHACTAPLHERQCMQGLLIDTDACDAADPSRLILEGVLTSAILPQLFVKVLGMLKRTTATVHINTCVAMLQNLDIVYPNTGAAEEGPHTWTSMAAAERARQAAASQQWYIPSIFPRNVPQDLPVHVSRLLERRGVHRGMVLTPFPKELMHMLHCRIFQMLNRVEVTTPGDRPRKVCSNWRDGWWLSCGGGQGAELGAGPVRALAVADVEANRPAAGGRLDIWAVEPPDYDKKRMGAAQLVQAFSDALTELLFKYPGITVQVESDEPQPAAAADAPAATGSAADEGAAALDDETLDACLQTFEPAEADFLLSALKVDLTAAQRERLAGMPATTASRDMRLSLLLDKMVRREMLNDPQWIRTPGPRSPVTRPG
eukprot:TRINITY_DN2114_c0_g1_i1.p1 TRINITY_DN2114_c0_g1~~TRINITY_DN2114_c0_g1_i1.p1  ORF type:complete len:846 (+),score=225.32 TRINITY_DN2114_c0_g1_i1:65-2539(+)